MTLQLMGDSEPGRLSLGYVTSSGRENYSVKKCTLTIARRDQLRETRLRNETAESISV